MWALNLLLPIFFAVGALSRSGGSQAALRNANNEELASSTTSALLSLHRSLVEQQSTTGSEAAVTDFLVSYLRGQNLTVEKQLVTSSPPRHNVLAYGGAQRRTRTLVTSHLDTVPPYWRYERRGDEEIWGRGTVDAKGSVAAQITAVLGLLGRGAVRAEGDVALLFVVGEETGGDGMRRANALGLAWHSVIFGEPTGLKLAAGHKGMLGCVVRARGKAGHSGYPELGRSANAMLVAALHELLRAPLPASPKYGKTTLNIGRIDGGVAANVIAEEAAAHLAIRIAAGEPRDVLDILERAVARAGFGDDLTVSPVTAGYGPVPIDHDVDGFDTIVVSYGTDIPNLDGHHKSYLYGPGDILVAHSDHEHLNVSDLVAAVEGYEILIKESLSKS
ncbi:MAG: hypothetical protein M1818_001725 [Claussenomyces sp. TS43310]|nr:MAG: hypothetical protein M1818_001725 [Claussenomyces sp. TS43310]